MLVKEARTSAGLNGMSWILTSSRTPRAFTVGPYIDVGRQRWRRLTFDV